MSYLNTTFCILFYELDTQITKLALLQIETIFKASTSTQMASEAEDSKLFLYHSASKLYL